MPTTQPCDKTQHYYFSGFSFEKSAHLEKCAHLEKSKQDASSSSKPRNQELIIIREPALLFAFSQASFHRCHGIDNSISVSNTNSQCRSLALTLHLMMLLPLDLEGGPSFPSSQFLRAKEAVEIIIF
jgi:hypothetical protein